MLKIKHNTLCHYATGDETNDESGVSKESVLFGHLPYDVHTKIFDKLTISEKLRTLSVSKAWCAHAFASLRKVTKLDMHELSPELEPLSISAEGFVTVIERLIHPATRCTRLKSICLTDVKVDLEDIAATIFSLCPELQQFYGHLPCRLLPCLARNCKNLQMLYCCGDETDLCESCEENIGQLVAECPKLRVLDIRQMIIEDDDSPFEKARCPEMKIR